MKARFLTMAAAVALALGTGSAFSNTARAGDCSTWCASNVTSVQVFEKTVALGAGVGILVGAGYLVYAHQTYRNGELRAQGPDENMQKFLANAQGYTATPAYALVTPASIAQAK